jgi:hypothetical protein
VEDQELADSIAYHTKADQSFSSLIEKFPKPLFPGWEDQESKNEWQKIKDMRVQMGQIQSEERHEKHRRLKRV